MTGLFLLALALLGYAMMLVAMLMNHARMERTPIAWILPSPATVARAQPAASVRPVLLRMVQLLCVAVLLYAVYWQLVDHFQIRGMLLSYLAMPILFVMMELLVAVATLLCFPTGRLLPALHRRPWLARSVADFWGYRWNLWFSDWFRQTLFAPLRYHPLSALFLVFTVSGLMHEWVLNVPLYCITGRAPFGAMMIYFLFQATGILLEHLCRIRPRYPLPPLVWLVVFAPVPLVINEGQLRVLHLWPA